MPSSRHGHQPLRLATGLLLSAPLCFLLSLTQKQYLGDARGIFTGHSYHALNRLTQKSYSDGTPGLRRE